MKLLVVDDDHSLLRAVGVRMSRRGWEVTEATLPVNPRFHMAVLLDWNPHGLEMLRRCREDGMLGHAVIYSSDAWGVKQALEEPGARSIIGDRKIPVLQKDYRPEFWAALHQELWRAASGGVLQSAPIPGVVYV